VKEFATGHIRNVALVAHHGVGKTSLAEAMLYQAKATTRIGRIADGSTLLDHSPEEISRQITIDLGLAQFEFKGHKVNLLDTPGYADFVGDVYSALRVADSAILVLRAATGVEVGTEVVWEVLKQEKSPLLVVVNMMDKEHANFDAAVKSCHDRLGLNAVPAQLPIGEADKFHGVVDLIENKAYTFTGKGADEKSSEAPIPAEMKDRVAKARAALMEEAATGDEQLMEKFLSTGDLSVEEIRKGLCERVVMCDLAPVFCCSAALNLGVAIPSSPGFVGTYQWLGVSALALFGIGREEGLAFAICMQAVWYVPTTIVGAVILVAHAKGAWRSGEVFDFGSAPKPGVRLQSDT